MSKSIILEQLQKSKENKQIIGIWKYNDSEGFWSGYIEDITDELYIIQHFTKYGKSDGVIIEQISNIESIDFDDDYSRAMHYLIEHHAELDKQENLTINTDFSKDWQKSVLLQVEGNNNRIVRVEINGDDEYSGFVERVSDSDFLLHAIGKLGEDEAKVIYRLEDVTSIRIEDIDNRKRLLLYNWRKAKNQ